MTLLDSFRAFMLRIRIDTRYGRLRDAKIKYVRENNKEYVSLDKSANICVLVGLGGPIAACCFVSWLTDYSAFFKILYVPLIAAFVWTLAYIGTINSKMSYILYSVPDEIVGGLDHE